MKKRAENRVQWAAIVTSAVMAISSVSAQPGGGNIKLNDPLVAMGSIVEAAITPDDTRAVYRAD